MLWLLRKFWKSLAFISGVVGVLFLPARIQNAETSLEPWGTLFSYVTQNNALWLIAIAAMLYVLWIDFRPFVQSWFLDPISIVKLDINRARVGQRKTSSAYMVITNRSKRSIKNLKVQLFTYRDGKRPDTGILLRNMTGGEEHVSMVPSDSEFYEIAVAGREEISEGMVSTFTKRRDGGSTLSQSPPPLDGEILISWENGGPISKRIVLQFGDDGFLKFDDLGAASTAAKSSPTHYTITR